MKKKTAAVFKWIGVFVIALGVLHAVLLALSNRALRSAYAALEADGRPLTAEQIIPAELPDPENAALVYESVVLQLKAVAGTCLPSAAQHQEVERLLAEFDDLRPFAAAMDGERLLLGEWAFNMPRASLCQSLHTGRGGFRERAIVGAIGLSPTWRYDHAAYLKTMHAYATAASVPYSLDDATLGEDLVENIPRYCILTRMLVPALSRAKGRYVGIQARARVLRAGLAILQARHRSGTFPDNLQALGGTAPDDPFTGTALRYQATPTNAVVYSVGENLVDDGGTTAERSREGDIAWRLPGEEGADTVDEPR